MSAYVITYSKRYPLVLLFGYPLVLLFGVAETSSTPSRVVFDNALTEEGFLGLARDLELLALPFATHTGFVSLFRRHASHMTQQ